MSQISRSAQFAELYKLETEKTPSTSELFKDTKIRLLYEKLSKV